MTRDLSRLASMQHDVVVIGGGIYGLAAAYDAAQRGLSVALIERGDFGGGTSFNHARTLHGGLRHLQSMDLRRMRESIGERRAFAIIAPHLVSPLAFLIPTYGNLSRSRLAMRIAFGIDEIVGRDRNAGVATDRQLPGGEIVTREECIRLFPGVNEEGLTGGAIWFDYQMPNAERLTIAFAHAAVVHGAALANYVEAEGPLREGARVVGVSARDVLTGEGFDIRGRVVLNCAGPWVGPIMREFGVRQARPLQKAMNIVTARKLTTIGLASRTPSGRALFMVPWRAGALLGTWHSSRPAPGVDADITERELEIFVDECNRVFPSIRLSPDDVTLVHRGLVPAAPQPGGMVIQKKEAEIRDHAADGADGFLSVAGVKYTTARLVAEQAVDLTMRKLGHQPAPCRTAETPLPGGDLSDVGQLVRTVAENGINAETAKHLVFTYGTGYHAVLDCAASNPEWLNRVSRSHPTLQAEVIYAARYEMARTLADAVARRTSLGSAGYPGHEAVATCAGLLRAELGWSDAQSADEIERLRQFYAPVKIR
jgi:glycerol-3-phosphate dehydrogenase